MERWWKLPAVLAVLASLVCLATIEITRSTRQNINNGRQHARSAGNARGSAFEPARGPEDEVMEGVFLPPDRTAKRRLEVAKEMTGEGRYGESVRYLGSLLEGSEDYFFRPEGGRHGLSQSEGRSRPLDRRLAGRRTRIVRIAVRRQGAADAGTRPSPAATWPSWPKSRGGSFTPRPAPRRRCCWLGSISTAASRWPRRCSSRACVNRRDAGPAVRADVVALPGDGLAACRHARAGPSGAGGPQAPDSTTARCGLPASR